MAKQSERVKTYVRQARLIGEVLAKQAHPDVLGMANHYLSWSSQIEELLRTNPDAKVLTAISAGFKQGLKELPGRIGRVRGLNSIDVERICNELAELQADAVKTPTSGAGQL